MSELTGTARSTYVRQMFARIASRYDLLNRLMTIGQDIRWRHQVISRAELEAEAILLDLGTGTGDLAFEALRRHPEAFVVAADFTPEMIWVAKARDGSEKIQWILCDALHLPFREKSFQAIVHGFLMRNLADTNQAIREQFRVLFHGGRMVSLDTTPPKSNLLRPLIEFHLHVVIPTLGKIFAGDSAAYTYLPDSTEKFLTAEEYREQIQTLGFAEVGFTRRMLGTVAIHWGRKPVN